MSSNKKFRIQNGVNITGEVVVGNQLVITSDGKLLVADIDVSVSGTVAADIAALQTQIDDMLGSSPDNLDTLQEIVSLFQSEDGDLSSLVSTNSSAIAAFQAAIDLKSDASVVSALTTSVSNIEDLVFDSDGNLPTLLFATSVVSGINQLNTKLASLSGGLCINYNTSTGVISVDASEVATDLHVASSGDTTVLNGQSGDYYRIDVRDVNGTLAN